MTLSDRDLTILRSEHTTASIAIAAGVDVKVVQRMLGHASAVMTLDRYGRLWDERLGDMGNLVGATRWPEAEADSSASALPRPGCTIWFE